MSGVFRLGVTAYRDAIQSKVHTTAGPKATARRANAIVA
jgi:hypothetical protein